MLSQIICRKPLGQLGMLQFYFIFSHSNLLQDHLLLSMNRGRLRVPEMNWKPKRSFEEERRSFSRAVLELSFQMHPSHPNTETRKRGLTQGEKRRFMRTVKCFSYRKGNNYAQSVNWKDRLMPSSSGPWNLDHTRMYHVGLLGERMT